MEGAKDSNSCLDLNKPQAQASCSAALAGNGSIPWTPRTVRHTISVPCVLSAKRIHQQYTDLSLLLFFIVMNLDNEVMIHYCTKYVKKDTEMNQIISLMLLHKN